MSTQEVRSVGVEEELLLVNVATGAPLPVAQEVLRADRAVHGTSVDIAATGSLEGELQQEQVEINTSCHTDLHALGAELVRLRRRAAAAAQWCGAAVAALGTSPLPARATLSPAPRYEWLARRYGATAADQLINGLHVHVSVGSREEAVAVLDRVRVWLPTVLALSANSPFWQGGDSRYASYRAEVWARWPSAGPRDVFGSEEAYDRHIMDMVESGVILDERMAYLDARPSGRYPTVEIRVADVCLRAEDTVLLAALCRGLVDASAEGWRAHEPPPDVPASTLRLARWRAGREGLEGDLLDPWSNRPRPAHEVVAQLLDHVRSALELGGDLADVEEGLDRLMRRGTGASAQRAWWKSAHDLGAVVAGAVEATSEPLAHAGGVVSLSEWRRETGRGLVTDQPPGPETLAVAPAEVDEPAS